jgi:RsiW-degrading membrane proteinase PrsW (M82 family)
MRARYFQAAGVMALALAAGTWAWVDTATSSLAALAIGAAGAPLAALLLVAGRMRLRIPVRSLAGGGTIGVLVALLSHAVVFAFAYAFFFGFADEASELLDRLRIDPRWSEALGSPWTLLLLIEVAVVAPLTEEMGKALGASVWKFEDRRGAFMAGVAAGAGFAIVENVLYGLGRGFFGEPWQAIVLGRMLGAAIHPLASGLVVMGWWEYKRHRDLGRLAVRFLAGAGVHAVWNGSIVALGITATAFDTAESFGTFTVVSLAYTAALGVVAAAMLWRVAAAVADGRTRRLTSLDARDGRLVAAWVVLSASFLVPMAVLLLAYPDFVGG